MFRRGRSRTYDEQSLYEYAVGALGRRMRSVAEMKRLLRQRFNGQEKAEEMIERVVARLKEHRYLSDSQYAAAYAAYRREDKFGKQRVITDLKARGVHAEVIDRAVADAYSGSSEEKLARDFLRRKRIAKPNDRKAAARVFRTLARAGFSTRTAVGVLKKWNVEEETLAALQEEAEIDHGG